MSEYTEQSALFEWAAIVAERVPELSMLLAIPNGEYRHKATAARLRAAGVKAGVPDICLPVQRDGCGALWIELKQPGGRISPAQNKWIVELSAHGQWATVCVGWTEAARTICRYLGYEPSDLGL